MATAGGRTDPALAELLLQVPWDFDFFQAVRLLGLTKPGRYPISRFRQPLAESVRFHAHQSLAFPASAIQEIVPGATEDSPWHMTVNFMGLTGPIGVLPVHYTEYLLGRSYVRDNSAAAFFDLFNHRLISLFYLAWEKHHFPVAYEQESVRSGRQSKFTRYLFDFIGMGTRGLQKRLEIPDSFLLSYCGLIAQRPRSAVALSGILRDYFRVHIEIEQFIGRWSSLEDDDLSYLGGGSVSSQLGLGAVAGSQVWNAQARFRICVGPLTWKRFQSFLPGQSALRELTALVRYFVNQSMDFEVQCVLLAEDVPRCQLASGQGAPRLGVSSWLKTAPFSMDAKDLTLVFRGSGGP